MDNLKAIWEKLHEAQIEIEQLMHKDSSSAIIDTFRKEEALRQKYLPWMLPYLAFIMTGMTLLVYHTNPQFGSMEVLGLFLIACAGFIMIYIPQSIRIPIQSFSYGEATIPFVRAAQEKIGLRRKYLLHSTIAMMILLTGGLFCLIFGNQPAPSWRMIVYFFAFTVVLSGVAVTGTMLGFDRYYKPLLERMEKFLLAH
ncbi:MAG: hypothetical protein AAF798_12120 [Bacteroidota bacterium]